MFKYLWLIIILLGDIGIFIYIFKELPYAIKHKQLDDFFSFNNDASTYIILHIFFIFIASFVYWITTIK